MLDGLQEEVRDGKCVQDVALQLYFHRFTKLLWTGNTSRSAQPATKRNVMAMDITKSVRRWNPFQDINCLHEWFYERSTCTFVSSGAKGALQASPKKSWEAGESLLVSISLSYSVQGARMRCFISYLFSRCRGQSAGKFQTNAARTSRSTSHGKNAKNSLKQFAPRYITTPIDSASRISYVKLSGPCECC